MHLCLGTTPTVQQTMIFDRVVADDVNRARQVRRAASGKPINVARVLRTLGESVRLCLPLGGDTGRFIRADLDAAAIPHDSVETAAPTRTCVTVIDRAAATATELVQEPAPLAAGDEPELLHKLALQLPGAKTLILSGSLAPGISENFYRQCCAAAQSAGVAVILDGRGQALKLALPARPFLVKPNRSELASTLGLPIDDDHSLRNAMTSLQRQGARWVIVTLGRDGAVVFDGSSFWKVAALKIDPISAIGSGDAFTAGLAAAIAAGRDVPDACRLATACAAANALMPGAGFLHLDDVRRLEPQVHVHPWDR